MRLQLVMVRALSQYACSSREFTLSAPIEQQRREALAKIDVPGSSLAAAHQGGMYVRHACLRDTLQGSGGDPAETGSECEGQCIQTA